MNIYYCNNFNGHYPVGTSAIIIAKNKTDALLYLESKLKDVGLEQKIDSNDIKLIDKNIEGAIILNDGEY